MPPLSFESPFLIRISLVSAFLPEMTQQIHSLRASGVISSHTARAAGVCVRAFRKSAGIVCTVPPASFWIIRGLYQNCYSGVWYTCPSVVLPCPSVAFGQGGAKEGRSDFFDGIVRLHTRRGSARVGYGLYRSVFHFAITALWARV